MKPFVPNAAQSYFEELLNGKSGEFEGLIERFEQKKQTPDIQAGDGYYERLIRQILLLTDDDRMKSAYSLLLPELENEQQWRGFFSSGLRANYNYIVHREYLDRGKKLASKISATANKLAEELSKFESIEIDNTPKEFSSLWHLLYRAGEDVWSDGMIENWVQYRDTILGDEFVEAESKSRIEYREIMNPIAAIMQEDQERSVRKREPSHPSQAGPDDSKTELQNAWVVAPGVQALLKTLAARAAQYEPSQIGMVGAGNKLRERTLSTTFIRGFAYLLTEENSITLSTNIKKAMATVATVLLDDGDIDISYDDVRKALKKS
jgi:hypothetical protein